MTDHFNTKRYPLVYVHKGVSQAGISLVGPYENTDEIEDLVKTFRSEIISTRHESVDESEAEGKFDDLYKVRCVFAGVCVGYACVCMNLCSR